MNILSAIKRIFFTFLALCVLSASRPAPSIDVTTNNTRNGGGIAGHEAVDYIIPRRFFPTSGWFGWAATIRSPASNGAAPQFQWIRFRDGIPGFRA